MRSVWDLRLWSHLSASVGGHPRFRYARQSSPRERERADVTVERSGFRDRQLTLRGRKRVECAVWHLMFARF
jgi:hypothetical protein